MSKIKASIKSVQAFAPATCANVAVGFDILGFAFDSLGDVVTLTRRDDQQIVIESVSAKESLPLAVQKNTASVVIEKLYQSLDLDTGFSIHIQKGIPLCSGMGGSAASAVAALLACNQFLISPLSKEELAYFALFGEQVASGEPHADNIVPCLFGGLTLIQSQNPLKVIELPIPDLHCVLLHPHIQVATREARAVLKKDLFLSDYVKQSAHLASFIASLYRKDMTLLRQSMHDLIIEPQRASLIPEFYKIKEAAVRTGALGMSLSGSGPTLFAFAKTEEEAKEIGLAMQEPLNNKRINSDFWIAPMSQNGARVVLQEDIL